ncbi:MAG: hypothetical protein ACRBCL_04900 [Maritimibacter sp.]
MSMLAILLGAALGLGLVFAVMRLPARAGRLGLLLIIAAFYPAFAIMAEDIAALVLHCVVLALFAALGWITWKSGPSALALAILAHGVFDAVLHVSGHHIGPAWWPEFCAAVDITLGFGLLWCDRKAGR